MTYDPETAERLADEIDNLCGFDAMADPQSVLMKAQELSDMIRAQAAEIARLKNALHVTAEQGNAVAKELAGRIHTLIDTPAPPAEPAEIDALREALLDAAAHLVAAISLLERGGKAAKKAAPSDKMFDQMLNDYRASADRARAALAAAPAPIQPAPHPDVGAGIYGECAPFTVKNGTEMDPQAALREATNLATVLHRKHYADDAPNWKPETDLMGLLLQIDNMTAGLTRASQPDAQTPDGKNSA